MSEAHVGSIVDVSTDDLHLALESMTIVASILKRRFNNLNANEINVIAKEIVYALHGVTK